MPEENKLPSISLYKRIAVSFVFLTIVLVVVIGYFAWGRVVVKVEPLKQKNSVAFFIDAGERTEETEGLADLLPAKILETTVEDTRTFPTTGKKTIEKEGDIVGTITVKNDSNQLYNFIARTRFMSPDGIIFRMKNRTTIPANGSADVSVYADDKAFAGIIDPSTFTIPGLRADTQKLVYGVTTEPLSAGDQEVYYVQEEDIKNAKETLAQELKMKALSEMESQLKFRERIFTDGLQIEVLEESIDPSVGSTGEDFNLTMKAKVIAISLDQQELSGEMESRIVKLLPEGTELMNFDPEALQYAMEKYDPEGKIITFKVSYNGESVITKGHRIFDKKNLIGLDEQGVKDYFTNFENVESVKVDFSPFWVRRVPNLIDRIELIIVK